MKVTKLLFNNSKLPTASFLSINTAKSLAQRNLDNVRKFFGDDLDITEHLVVMNARLSQSPEMMNFRKTLKFAHDAIKVGYIFIYLFIYNEHFY